jgi:DNA-binding CsgD family transcriptional regulator
MDSSIDQGLDEFARRVTRGTTGKPPHAAARDAPGQQIGQMAPTVIGREAELVAIDAFLDGVPEGPAGLVLAGEAGIGKTTVLDAALQMASARGHRVLSVRAAQSETMLSFAAFTDLLAPVADEVLPALPGPQRRAVEAALLLAEPGGSTPDHRAVSAGFVSAIAALAARAPLLVAVDDIQWLDRPSARVMEFAARRLGQHRVGILASVRIPDAAPIPLGLDRALSEDRLTHLRLGPVTVAVLHHIIRDRLGVTFPRAQLLRVGRASGGNPFFALEIARVLKEEGSGGMLEDALLLPESLRAMVAARISSLPATTRRGLAAAAALADPTVEAVRRATGNRGSLAGLTAALRAGVIEVEGDFVRFTHPLLASAAYPSEPPERRRRLHHRLAGVVGDPEERAHHLALSAAGPGEAVAAALEEAAGRAERRGAPDRAAELWEEAARLTPVRDGEDAWRRITRAGACHFESGDGASAKRLLEHVIAAAPPGPLRSEALRVLAMVHYRDDSVLDAIELLQRARGEAEDRPRVLAEVEFCLAWAVLWSGNVPGSLEHAETALRLLRASQDEDLLGSAKALVVGIEWQLGRPLRREELNRAEALEASAGHLPMEWSPSFLGAFIRMYTDDLEGARGKLDRLRRDAEARGEDAALPFILYQCGQIDVWTGDFDEAVRTAQLGCEIAARSGQRAVEAANVSCLAMIHALRGAVDLARAGGERVVEVGIATGIAPVIQFGASALGFLELSLGNAEAADRHLAPVADLLAAAGMGEPGIHRFLPDEVEALVSLGQLDRAAVLLDRFENTAWRVGRRWALATGARCRALIASARGDQDEALAAADRAIEHHGGLPYRFDHARTLLVKGAVHRRRKEKAAARSALEAARRIFEGLGTPLWEDRARAELRRLGLRPPTRLELTPTEERVARLAASGFTNRQVAQALFVSPKTVETNLGRVYRKLGIHSRAELGATMGAR